MLLLNNDFIGYEPLDHNVFFSGSDTEELYNKNLKSKSNDWYYRTNQIRYIVTATGIVVKKSKTLT